MQAIARPRALVGPIEAAVLAVGYLAIHTNGHPLAARTALLD